MFRFYRSLIDQRSLTTAEYQAEVSAIAIARRIAPEIAAVMFG